MVSQRTSPSCVNRTVPRIPELARIPESIYGLGYTLEVYNWQGRVIEGPWCCDVCDTQIHDDMSNSFIGIECAARLVGGYFHRIRAEIVIVQVIVVEKADDLDVIREMVELLVGREPTRAQMPSAPYGSFILSGMSGCCMSAV